MLAPDPAQVKVRALVGEIRAADQVLKASGRGRVRVSAGWRP